MDIDNIINAISENLNSIYVNSVNIDFQIH